MASSMKSIKSKAPSCTCPEGCRVSIAARDLHVVCLAFLGPEHAKTDITDTCQTRARRTRKICLFPKWSLSPGYPTGIDEWHPFPFPPLLRGTERNSRYQRDNAKVWQRIFSFSKKQVVPEEGSKKVFFRQYFFIQKKAVDIHLILDLIVLNRYLRK